MPAAMISEVWGYVTNKHEKIEKALWQEVKKYRRNVLLDPQARKKARLAAALSYSGYAMTRRVYEKTQWRGKK